MTLNKGTYSGAVKVAVLSLMIAQYANSVLSPITGVLYAEFPDQLSLVKMVSSINYLACSIPLILMEPLSARFTKKQLSLAGILLVLVGVVPAFVYGMEVLFISQFICGMGIGLMYAFAASYIVDLWDGEEANRMMGNRSTVGVVAGILYAQFAGRASNGGDYQPAFLCLLVMILVFIVCLKLPKTYPVEIEDKKARAEAKASGATKTKKMYVMTWCLCSFTIVVLCFAMTMMIDIGIIGMADPAEGGLGLSSAMVGNVMTMFSASMVISGLIYARVWVRIFKTYATAAGVGMLFLGMLILVFASNVPMLIVGVFIFGFGFQCYNGHIMQLIPMTTVPTGATFGISMFFVFTNIGSFLASIVTPSIAGAILPGVLRGDWYIAAVGLLICAIVEFCFCKKITAKVQAGVWQ